MSKRRWFDRERKPSETTVTPAPEPAPPAGPSEASAPVPSEDAAPFKFPFKPVGAVEPDRERCPVGRCEAEFAVGSNLAAHVRSHGHGALGDRSA